MHDPGDDEYRGNVQPEIYTGWQNPGDPDASDSGMPEDEPSEFYH